MTMRRRPGLRMRARPFKSRPPVPLYPILVVNFVGTLGFSIVLPFLVYLVTRWGGNAYGPWARPTRLSARRRPDPRPRSDRWGRRKILLLSHWNARRGRFSWWPSACRNALVAVDLSFVGRLSSPLPIVVMRRRPGV
jgi:hypothetical protein